GLCRKHFYLGSDRNPVVEMDDILVDHSDAAGRHAGANRLRLDCSMDAVERVDFPLPQIEPAGADRIAWPARHALAALQVHELRLDIGPPRDHFGRRIPVRPLLLAVDGGRTIPLEALLADAN